MSRYIDADALREKVLYHADTMNHAGNHEQAKAYNHCLCMIDDMPTADVVERKRGKWIIREPIHMHSICSCCGYYNAISPYYEYCPNCGADMRGAEEGRVE